MSNLQEILINLLIHSVAASPFVVICVTGRAGLFTPAFGLIAAVIMAPPLARLLAEPWGGLFYPVRRSSRPGPVYSIPQSKRANGQYEDAMDGFETIAKEFPCDIKPYLEMISIAVRDLKDPDRAKDVYERGIKNLKKDAEKEALARMYSAVRSTLD